MSSGEGTSTSTPKAAIPKEVIAKLAEFNKALGEVEQALSKHFAVPFEQHVSERNALEMTRIDVMSIFTLSSLGWVLASMKGEEPNNSAEIRTEIARSKDYYDRLKVLESRKTAPRISSVAAKNFVRNALWEIPQSEKDS